jgi:rubrerythrin
MESYICSNCRYKFKTSKTPRSCPYCDKVGVLEREKSASEIVDEIQSLIE